MNRIFSFLLVLLIICICSASVLNNFSGEKVFLPIHELNRSTNMPIVHIKDERFFNAAPSLLFQPQKSSDHIILKNSETTLDFTNLNFLILEIYCDTEFSVVMNIDFFKQGGEEPQISARIGINPKLTTQVIFPLSYLDGQEIFFGSISKAT